MTFLDKQGGTMKDGGGKSDAAVRMVRAKREAEEAGTLLPVLLELANVARR